MPFQPLEHVLGQLQIQGKADQKPLQRVLGHWEDIVGSVVAAQTRPLAIQRGVLRVATSSAAWANNLVYERQRILDKLNTKLGLNLADIRFSSAEWYSHQETVSAPGTEQQQQLWQEHPSRLSDQSPAVSHRASEPADAIAAFRDWAKAMRARSYQLPLCPQCHCPTPPGELERWQVCAHCATKQW
ncbi:DUF721 domain-containing protein [Pantanalinema rosaneae CENA516]|uniref:DUF721 domain-containing protein n=1 Tax=Pantanalinema rosaneae TaxID=1620701 RepID=UPI003D6EACB3